PHKFRPWFRRLRRSCLVPSSVLLFVNKWSDYQAYEKANDDQGRLFPGEVAEKSEHGNLHSVELSVVTDRSEESYRRKSKGVKGKHNRPHWQKAPLSKAAGWTEPDRDGTPVWD